MTCLAYLVELFPYAEQARGIAVEQFFGRGAGFFSTYVNPIALKAITWKYLAIYCGWITVEVLFVFFFYPETYGRTLEELAFCKSCLLFLTLLRSSGYRTGSYPKPRICMADFHLQCSKTSHWQTMSWSLSRSRSIMGTRNTETWWNLRMLRRLRRKLLSDHKLTRVRRTLISPFESVVDSRDRVLYSCTHCSHSRIKSSSFSLTRRLDDNSLTHLPPIPPLKNTNIHHRHYC